MDRKERRTHIITKLTQLVRKLLSMSLVRYALVGGVGIPVNEVALGVFLYLFGYYQPHPFAFADPLAVVCSFEVSTTVNFVLNQTFTYRDQMKGIYGWRAWVKRASKAQLTSLSSMAVSFIISLSLTYFFHVTPYIANFVGIVIAFFYNYTISKRFVFRSAQATNPPSDGDIVAESESDVFSQAGVSTESVTGD
jgi:putative flippase GtrA